MKKMNRFTIVAALLLAVLLTFGLVACDEKEPNAPEGGETTEQPAVSGDTTAEPSDADTTTEAATEPPAAELPTDAFGYLSAVLEKGFTLGKDPSAAFGENTLTQLVFNGTADTELFVPGLSLDMKLYSALTAGALELNASVSELPIDLKVYGNENAIAFGSSALLGGDGIYGVDLKNAEQNFASSIFANPESAYYLGIESLEEALGSVNEAAALAGKMEEILNKYVDVMVKVMTDNGYATIADREGGGKTVTVTLNGAGAEALIRAVYNTAKTDADLRALVAEIVAMQDTGYEDDFAVDYDEEYAEEDSDPMAEYDAFFASEDVLNALIAELKTVDFTVTFAVDTNADDALESASFVFRAVVDGEEGTISAVIDLSEEDKAVVMISFDIPDTAYETEAGEDLIYPEEMGALPFNSLALIFSADEDTDDRYVASVTLEMDSGAKVQMELCKVTYEKKTGAYTLELGRGLLEGDVIAVKGVVTASETEMTLTVTEISAAALTELLGKTTLALDLTVSVKTVDAIPAVPAYTDLLTLTEDQMNALLVAITESPLGQLLAPVEPDYGYDEDVWGDEEWSDEDIWVDEDWSDEDRGDIDWDEEDWSDVDWDDAA